MVRAPCCEKMGLKKGPWTPEEDQILINYIQLHGHGNWRALPKQAGLLRCGKSCRLRWTNYLRPDIKRGNFTREEEDTIINLHEKLGNKWSAIAARLPGRTDNEIKNVWHTHLKKRLKPNHGGGSNNNNNINLQQLIDSSKDIKKEEPAQSSSEVSTVTTSENNSNAFTVNAEANRHVSEIDENFWSEVLSADNSNVAGGGDYFPSCAPPPLTTALESVNEYVSDVVYENEANMDFWYNLFTRAEDLPGISEF